MDSEDGFGDDQLEICVLQASGMVSVQAECTFSDAVAMMRDRGLVQHESLINIAQDVVSRRIRFN
jgi:hypothetical protein